MSNEELEIEKTMLKLRRYGIICDGCDHQDTPCSAMSTAVINTNGSQEIDVLIVGQGAGKDEDININKGNFNREPFVGRAGKYLRHILLYIWQVSGVHFNVALSNNVRCHPVDQYGKDRPPTTSEIERCSQYLVQDIKKLNPRCILAVGKNATMTFFPELAEMQMSGIRHLKRPKQYQFGQYEMGQYNIVSTYHPSYLCRQYSRYSPLKKNLFDMRFVSDLDLALNGAISNCELF